jgi:hypothetical protein
MSPQTKFDVCGVVVEISDWGKDAVHFGAEIHLTDLGISPWAPCAFINSIYSANQVMSYLVY